MYELLKNDDAVAVRAKRVTESVCETRIARDEVCLDEISY